MCLKLNSASKIVDAVLVFYRNTKRSHQNFKKKGFEEVAEWIRPCENHLHWSAASTHNGDGIVIWAKFKAFMSHVVNKHSDLEDPVFNKCAHGEIGCKKWLVPGYY